MVGWRLLLLGCFRVMISVACHVFFSLLDAESLNSCQNYVMSLFPCNENYTRNDSFVVHGKGYPIGLIDGTELGFGLGFVGGISIRVPFHRQSFVCFTNIWERCRLWDPKNSVKVRRLWLWRISHQGEEGEREEGKGVAEKGGEREKGKVRRDCEEMKDMQEDWDIGQISVWYEKNQTCQQEALC